MRPKAAGPGRALGRELTGAAGIRFRADGAPDILCPVHVRTFAQRETAQRLTTGQRNVGESGSNGAASARTGSAFPCLGGRDAVPCEPDQPNEPEPGRTGSRTGSERNARASAPTSLYQNCITAQIGATRVASGSGIRFLPAFWRRRQRVKRPHRASYIRNSSGQIHWRCWRTGGGRRRVPVPKIKFPAENRSRSNSRASGSENSELQYDFWTIYLRSANEAQGEGLRLREIKGQPWRDDACLDWGVTSRHCRSQ